MNGGSMSYVSKMKKRRKNLNDMIGGSFIQHYTVQHRRLIHLFPSSYFPSFFNLPLLLLFFFRFTFV
jgi:hypothetical protein